MGLPTPELDNLPQFKESNTLAYKLFADLSRTRTSGMNGPNPIQYSEILALSKLLDIHLSELDIEKIMILDSELLSYHLKQRKG